MTPHTHEKIGTRRVSVACGGRDAERETTRAAMRSPEEREALFDHFDVNGNDEIHFDEFSFAFFNRRGLVTKWRLLRGPGARSEASIMSSFRSYDVNRSGKLEQGEFARALEDMGLHLSDLEFDILARRLDVDGDGFIQPQEFVKFVQQMQKEDAKVRKETREARTKGVLDDVRETARKATSIDPKEAHARALRKKIRAQEESIEALRKFIEDRGEQLG